MDRTPFGDLLLGRVSRRRFLCGSAGLAGLALARDVVAQDSKTGIPSYPFTLGVASGDPLPDGVVLWTRLAPAPMAADGLGGMPPARVAVRWEVATDAGMRNVVQRGAALAVPDLAHSVHVELRGLRPGWVYYYRFLVGPYASPVGRTKTAPAPGVLQDRFRFAFASCSDYQNGYFAAYRWIAEEDLDLVVHLGDYIYEYDASSVFSDRQHSPTDPKPPGFAADQLVTLADYRRRHAQYKTDPHLQAAHAAHPWVVTWDDHETENNYADEIDEIGDNPQTPPGPFRVQRGNAYQAYYEHMPIRIADAIGPALSIYRRLTFGGLARLNILDTRQYRSDQPVDLSNPIGAALAVSDFRPSLPPPGDPTALLGADQQEGLLADLDASSARWNIIANQVMMAQFNYGRFIPVNQGGPVIYNVDQWDGYRANRQVLLEAFARQTGKNFVIITGDIHSAWAQDLKLNFDDPASATVATEFICSSITAEFPTALLPAVAAAAQTTPHTKFFDGQNRGYVVCTLTPEQWRNDFRAVRTVDTRVPDPNAPVTTLASFAVLNGVPGAVRL